jgi:hypothetical protein
VTLPYGWAIAPSLDAQHHDTIGEKLRLYDRPVEGHRNKFVITEDAAYFVPCLDNSPALIEILAEIFDLDDPQVHRDVDGRLFGGRIILGYFEPDTKEVVILSPTEPSAYLQRRIEDVFGV